MTLPSTDLTKQLPELQAAMAQLKAHAKHVVQNEPQSDHMICMRNKAAELGIELDAKDGDLLDYLDQAERALNPAKVYEGNEILDASEPSFLLDGLIQLGETNLIVGQPKVGKSSFSCGLIAALRDRLPTFLGRDLAVPSTRMPVLLFGTDQSIGNWLHFLKREQLVSEEQKLDGNAIDFFCDIDSSDHFNFTKEGLARMRMQIDQHQFPLVIIDSLNSMMEPTGLEENNSHYAKPIRNAIRELRKTGATLVIIHHTRKVPLSWDWIAECRGSSSISSVMSWGVLMRWVSQEEEGLMRTDKRVGFVGKGRGSGESGGVMAEYLAEGGWQALGGLEEAQKVERTKQRISEIGGVRAQVFDYLTQRTELGADVTADELATELNKTRSNVSRELNNLKSKGLAFVTRAEQTGARPRSFWRLTQAAAIALGLEAEFLDSDDSLSFNPLKINRINKFNSQGTEQPAKESPATGTPVEVLRGSSWSNGYVIHDASNLDAITVQKLGTPSITISNLRWDLDIRPCTPFQPPSVNPDDLDF